MGRGEAALACAGPTDTLKMNADDLWTRFPLFEFAPKTEYRSCSWQRGGGSMKLRHAVWVALAGVLFAVPSAVATPEGSSTEPALQQAAAMPSGDLPEAVPLPTTRQDAAAAAAVSNPSLTNTQSTPDSRPETVSGAEAGPVLMPAAFHVPLPSINPFKPEVTLKAIIDLSKQRMTVMNGDEVLHVWPISSGRRGYITPNGTYYPQWRARMWRSKQYGGAPMPYSVFFHRGYAVHGTYATGLLGRPASHGCIRLSNKNAATFYKLVDEHGMQSTQIVVQGKTSVGSTRVAKRSRSAPRRRTVRRRQAPRGYANYGTPPWWTW